MKNFREIVIMITQRNSATQLSGKPGFDFYTQWLNPLLYRCKDPLYPLPVD